MLDNLEIEIKKRNGDYSFSSEEDDKKRIYIIYSSVLKEKLRKIISPFGVIAEGSVQYEGKNSQGDRILYQQGEKNDLPDQLTLISREISESPKNIADEKLWKREVEREKKEDKEWEKWDAEWEKTRDLWRKHEKGLEVSGGSIKHYFCGRNDKGEVVTEGTYIKSENQSQIMVLERGNKSLEWEEDQKNDNSSQTTEKKEVFTQHQIPPKK